jgi:hypothetical protein
VEHPNTDIYPFFHSYRYLIMNSSCLLNIGESSRDSTPPYQEPIYRGGYLMTLDKRYRPTANEQQNMLLVAL